MSKHVAKWSCRITISCDNVTMADFTAQLPRLTGAWLMGNPVADMTGLQGGWSFTVKMSGRNWLKAAGRMAFHFLTRSKSNSD